MDYKKATMARGDVYFVTYKWETGNETVESTRTMKTMPVGTVFDRLGSPYGKCVGQVNEDGSCAKVESDALFRITLKEMMRRSRHLIIGM